MKSKIRIIKSLFAVAAWTWVVAAEPAPAKSVVIRAGHMPNVTHAQAVIARAKSWFDGKVGEDVSVRWQSFNAGPSIVEAIFADQIDIAYVGPGPAINGYVKSEGEALRVIAGAANGGAAFVVRERAGIQAEKDLPGKKLATPQLGNTQDIALRAWLQGLGLKPKEKGGTVTVLPTANADQLTLFQKGQLDGAWTVEPWVTRLVDEGGGRIFFDESVRWEATGGKYATTLLVVRKKFLDEHPKVVHDWVSAHVELTVWINAHRAEAIKLFNQELAKEIGKPLPEKVVESSFSRLDFTPDPIVHSVVLDGKMAFDLGFLGKKKPNLKNLFYLDFLQEILQVSYDILVDPNWWI